MLSLALTLLLLAGQPDDGPVSTNQVVPPPAPAALDEVKRQAEEKKRKDAETAGKLDWDWGIGRPPSPEPPLNADDMRAAANRAALERAEQAARDANTPPGGWPDEGKVRCKTTDSGFVCGNSDKALEPDSPSRKALDELLSKPN